MYEEVALMRNSVLIPTIESDTFLSPAPFRSEVISSQTYDLVEGLPAEEVHRRALAARKAIGGAQRSLCFWLQEVEKRKIFAEFGCSSTFHYAEVHLHLSPHTISELLRTAREIERFPLFAQGLAQGEISASKIREISRVAVESTEKFWLDAARKHTQREIEKMVAFTPKGGLPFGDTGERRITTGAAKKVIQADILLKAGDPERNEPAGSDGVMSSDAQSEIVGNDGTVAIQEATPAANEKGSEKGDEEGNEKKLVEDTIPGAEPGKGVKYNDKLLLELSGEQMAVVKDALNKARKESGLKDRASLFQFIAMTYLSADKMPEAKSSKPPYQIVLHHHPVTGLSWCESVNGERYIDSSTLEKAICDAEIINLCEEAGSPGSELEPETQRQSESGSTEGGQKKVPTVGLDHTCPGEICSDEHCRGEHKKASLPEGDCSGENPVMAYINSLYAQYKNREKSGCKRHSHKNKSGCKKHSHKERKASQSLSIHTIPRALRRKIMLRDQCTCQNPGCCSKFYVSLHHIVPLGAGGENVESNILILCGLCHDLVHMGKITVSGQAPHRLIWGNGRGKMHTA